MHIESPSDAIIICENAKKIRDNTPYSFRILTNKLEIFLPNSKNLMELFFKYDVDNMVAIPMFPSEIFSIAYSNIVDCPDDTCIKFQKKILDNKKQLDFDFKNLSNKDKDKRVVELKSVENKDLGNYNLLCHNNVY